MNPEILLLAPLGVLSWIAWTDLNEARISNQQNLALLGASLAVVATSGTPTHWIAFGIVLAACLSLWTMADGFGGGDAKMVPSVALAIGPVFPIFLAAMAFIGILLNVYRWALPSITWRRKTDMIPLGVAAAPAYAVALLAGGVL
ncbi:A24 family peptidase [Roseovarius sp. MBR-6]|jgi:Flp pilus assembly protein protease CpaA|uniref:A24 family peptidase n=1 Tax=Roseovarius sp. MBR-6 TaxID=3156459 RepID=UPI0033927D41